MIKSFAEWLQEGAANKQWRTENNRVKEFDNFIEHPDAEEIFQYLYQDSLERKPGGPEHRAIFKKMDESNVDYVLIKAEAIRFKGDFDRFVKAYQDPLFVLAGSRTDMKYNRPSRDSGISFKDIETWGNHFSRDDIRRIFYQISDPDRIPLAFFKRALIVITNPSVGYTDEEKIISFFNQPLQKQMIDIKSFEKGISPEDKNLANKGYRNDANHKPVGYKSMFGVGGDVSKGPEPEPLVNRFLRQQQDKNRYDDPSPKSMTSPWAAKLKKYFRLDSNQQHPL